MRVLVERGYVARVRGDVHVRSPLFISSKSAERWLSQQLDRAVRDGLRVNGKVTFLTVNANRLEVGCF